MYWKFRSSYPEVYLEKGVLKICSKFTREHPCRSAISIKLLCNFIYLINLFFSTYTIYTFSNKKFTVTRYNISKRNWDPSLKAITELTDKWRTTVEIVTLLESQSAWVCSPINLLHIFRAPFSKNTSGRCFWNFKWRFSSNSELVYWGKFLVVFLQFCLSAYIPDH